MKAKVPEDKKATEYLANERTFLAFVVAKFGVWLREFATRLDPNIQNHNQGASLWMGVGMMSLGGELSLLAVWCYHVVNLAIELGEVNRHAPI